MKREVLRRLSGAACRSWEDRTVLKTKAGRRFWSGGCSGGVASPGGNCRRRQPFVQPWRITHGWRHATEMNPVIDLFPRQSCLSQTSHEAIVASPLLLGRFCPFPATRGRFGSEQGSDLPVGKTGAVFLHVGELHTNHSCIEAGGDQHIATRTGKVRCAGPLVPRAIGIRPSSLPMSHLALEERLAQVHPELMRRGGRQHRHQHGLYGGHKGRGSKPTLC